MVKLAVICLFLPDRRMVLQRRSKDAPTAPGKLGFFGGHVEAGEKPEESVLREITEETSLGVNDLEIELVSDYILKADKDYPRNRHTFLFTSNINSLGFKVYEGDRAEAYSVKELLKRDDITVGVRYMLEKVWKEG